MLRQIESHSVARHTSHCWCQMEGAAAVAKAVVKTSCYQQQHLMVGVLLWSLLLELLCGCWCAQLFD